MKKYLALTSIILLLAGTRISSVDGGYAIIKDKDFVCQVGPDGSFSLDYQGYRLVLKDILSVKGKSGFYDYFIPEEERPPFATLLHPTFKGTRRKNYLDINQFEKDNIKFITCEGRKAGVVNFVKSYSLHPEEKKVDIEILYELLEPGASLEYLLALPRSFYENCPYLIKTNGTYKRGIIGEKGRNAMGSEIIKSLEIMTRIGKVSFVGGNAVCHLVFLPDKAQDDLYYILFKPLPPKGTIKIRIIIDKKK